MTSVHIRARAIRDVWRAVYGDDVTTGHRLPNEQYRVLCPFHAERNASCDVSLPKNTYLCRSCGASGGALSLVVAAGNAETHTAAIDWLESHGVVL